MQRNLFHMGVALLLAGNCAGLEKEMSLVTGQKIGTLAVAGKLDVDLHAEFMVSRTFENDTVLNWYNCGLSGGGKHTAVGGNFGNFGLDVPAKDRDAKYPHAVRIGEVTAVRFDGDDIMMGNFAVEPAAAGIEDLAIEVWLQDAQPAKGEVVFGWQSDDGKETSGAFIYPVGINGSEKLRHIVANCTAAVETWYVDGKKVASGPRKLAITAGHKMVLGGASARTPSFAGSLVLVRLHEAAMTEEEITHNFAGGVMLGTEMHAWWRTDEPDTWWVKEAGHFRHCVDKKEMAEWNDKQTSDFHARLPAMFAMAEKLYHLYSERMALRSSVVSNRREFRGDGIKYNTPIQPSHGSWMGFDGKLGFGWACQGAGHINPHELVHGWQAQTGGTMQGNYWEAHANFPQTYAGIYQTVPASFVSRVSMLFPAHGRSYYHDRLMFEHLAQTPEYGPMFISKLWYDAGTDKNKSEYPWTAFTKFDPEPATDLAYEWTRMVQKCITWDYEIFGDQPKDLYRSDAARNRDEIMRYGRVVLEPIPYDTAWWRVPKEMAPQQLGYNICPLTFDGGRVTAELDGYLGNARGGDWRAAFVGVKPDGKAVYGAVGKPRETITLETTGMQALYLVVCAVPTKIMEINMTGDYRSLEQEQFPYKLKLQGCKPLDMLLPEKPGVAGARHANGGGFVAATAHADATAYVGAHAQVLGNAKILGQARIEDYAVVTNSTVRDHAVVSGHARIEGASVVQDYGKIRDYGHVQGGAIVSDHAKIIEHGRQSGKSCGGYAVIKGVAWSHGSVRGTAMIDGSYAKSNDIDKGKWFTWNWSRGKNAGEVDEEFGGLYMQMGFNEPHDWMARDDFGATWGYLVGKPEIVDGALVLNGVDQFVELPHDVADMRDISIKAKVLWQGGADARILDFSNPGGACLALGVKDGKCLFAILRNGETQLLQGPALTRDKPVEIMVVLSEDTGTLFMDGKPVAINKKMTLNPDDLDARECYLGRSRNGGFFKGRIDSIEIFSVPTSDAVPPSPDPAQFVLPPLLVNPGTVVMQAVPGVDPLGNIDYYFSETSKNPGGKDSGWTKDSSYTNTGLEPGKAYAYTVKMRDTCGNITRPSAPVSVQWNRSKAFHSADSKTIVMEAESYTRSVPGKGQAAELEWKLSPQRDGCAGKGMMAALPDKGIQIDSAYDSQSPRLDYVIAFPAKGRYAVWMRTWGSNPSGDSLYIGLDLKDGSMLDTGNGKLRWIKHRGTINVDQPGLHTLNVWMREDGTAFDRLIVTSDLQMQEPQGEGPTESRFDF